METRTLLIIDPDPQFRQNAGRFLSSRGYIVHEAADATQGLEELRQNRPRFVLVDISLQLGGFDLVGLLVSSPERPDVLCVANKSRVPDVVAAMRAGALDVLERPIDGEQLIRILDRAAQRAPAPAPKEGVRAVELASEPKVDLLVSESAAMKNVLARVRTHATTENTLVLQGEFGAGLEELARYYLSQSPRAGGAFVVVHTKSNISAEDQLFGKDDILSAFSRAKGGMVFVESLASLGPSGQDRLLKLFVGLASARASGSAVRWPPLVLGAERPLMAEVEAGKLKKELVPYLDKSVVVVPPLRDRKDDIPELVRRSADAIRVAANAPSLRIDPQVLQGFVNRDWERNLPELMGEVRRCAVLAADDALILDPSAKPTLRPLPPPPKAPEVVIPVMVTRPVVEPKPLWQPQTDAQGRVQPFDVYEAEIFRFALKNAGGCVSRAAELLGVGRATMYRKMRAYDIDVPPVSERAITRNKRERDYDESEMPTSDVA